jgi:hypothetical protein
MKKVLMVLLTGALAVCALTSCNEPETATLDSEGVETIIYENTI